LVRLLNARRQSRAWTGPGQADHYTSGFVDCPTTAPFFVSIATMDFLIAFSLIAFGVYSLKSADQKRRIALLGSHLGQYEIEKLMAHLTDGYLRALGEADSARRAQIWQLLGTTEAALCEQFNRFVLAFSKVDAAQTRVSRLALALPHADKLFPQATFDLRKLLSIHAQGLTQAAQNSANRSPKDKAYTLSAELFLMQHTCHWFCRSRAVASARVLARHQTSHSQLLQAVAPATREAYLAITQG